MSAFGAVVQEAGAIPMSLRQARTALEYRYVIGGSRPLAWNELRMNTATLYQYDQENEARLMTAVQAGDQAAAGSLLDQIFAANTQAGQPVLSPLVAKCLIWDLGGSIMKALSEIAEGDDSFAEIMEPLGSLTQNPNLEKARLGMQAMVRAACGWAAQRNSQHQSQLKSELNRQFITRVSEWLRANYRDPSLNLAKIAEAHDLTPAYLSRLFRENTEEGIFDFLNRIRIEQAKVLLRNSEGNLQEIGLACGIVDIKTFIRTFKKLAGTTPGKYRESAK
jgi:AraC-like DNA-binding protein